jgi:hypothetical protein
MKIELNDMELDTVSDEDLELVNGGKGKTEVTCGSGEKAHVQVSKDGKTATIRCF